MITGNDLDECGGRIDHYGNYRYHIVLDTEPGILYCLKGEVGGSKVVIKCSSIK